jgi:hypothetical protein
MPDGGRDLEASAIEHVPDELADELMARHVEIQTLADMMGDEHQRGTPIPALYNMWYRFIQNPSTVSIESYKRMVDTDETIGSGVEFLISCLAARMGAYQHDDPEITRFVTRALAEMKGGFTAAVKEMLSAVWAGFSVSEIVWANKSIGFVPEKVVPLPPSSILFEVDRVGDLTDDGVLQYQRNYQPLGMGLGAGFFGGLAQNGFIPNRPDPMAKFGDLAFPLRSANTFNYMSIRIPKLKCVHIAWNGPGMFGNPYGRSSLRRAYNWWVQKWAYCQMMGQVADRHGTPHTVVYADQNATMVKAGTTSSQSTEQQKRANMERAPEAAARTFKNVHNDSVFILPGKKGQIFDVEVHDTSGNLPDFIAVLQFCNTMLMRALLIPSLIFTAGDGAGSYSLGQEHAKTFDKLLDSMLEGFKQSVLDQFIRQLIAYNFPKKVWQEKGLGDFAKRELTMEERQKEVEVFIGAIDKGIVDTNDTGDLNKMREAIGFEPRTTPIEKPMPMMPPGFGGEGVEPDGDEVEPDGDEPAGGGKPGGFGAGPAGPVRGPAIGVGGGTGDDPRAAKRPEAESPDA